ncbi:hypothetical protein CMO84_11240 [Candidatus Woesearchaeota archaeon]|nr:hypothetical protein [Candidatus Woesearchaeota archaeon]
MQAVGFPVLPWVSVPGRSDRCQTFRWHGRDLKGLYSRRLRRRQTGHRRLLLESWSAHIFSAFAVVASPVWLEPVVPHRAGVPVVPHRWKKNTISSGWLVSKSCCGSDSEEVARVVRLSEEVALAVRLAPGEVARVRARISAALERQVALA